MLELFERWGDSDEEPILLARSDNGPQMRAGTTREFLAMCSIAARFGRPGAPTDQAWIETLFGHVKTEWPPPRTDHRPQHAASRTRQRPHRLQHPEPARLPGLGHPRRRALGPRRYHPPGPPRPLARVRLTSIAYHRDNPPNQP